MYLGKLLKRTKHLFWVHLDADKEQKPQDFFVWRLNLVFSLLKLKPKKGCEAHGTLYAADPPEPWVREISAHLLGLRLLRADVGGVTDICPRIKPVVGPDGDAHQTKRHESPDGAQQHLNPTVTPRHGHSL